MKKKWLSIFCAGVLVFGSVTMADATTITLDFNSLPSAQGWTYLSDAKPPVAENSVFSVSGGILHQNSIGFPGRGSGYYLFGMVDPTLPFTLELRARVLQEANVDVHSVDWSFGASVLTGSQAFVLGIGTTSLYSTGGGSGKILAMGLDNTLFHDYRIEGTPGPEGFYNVFVDGVLIGSDVPIPHNVNYLSLGDITSDASSKAEVTRYVFSQGSTNPVPEPATMLLLGSGLAGLAGTRLRRKKK